MYLQQDKGRTTFDRKAEKLNGKGGPTRVRVNQSKQRHVTQGHLKLGLLCSYSEGSKLNLEKPSFA